MFPMPYAFLQPLTDVTVADMINVVHNASNLCETSIAPYVSTLKFPKIVETFSDTGFFENMNDF